MTLRLSSVAKTDFSIAQTVENRVYFLQDDWQLMPHQGTTNEFFPPILN